MEHERPWLWVDWFLFGLRLCWLGSGLAYYGVRPEALGTLAYPLFLIIAFICCFIPVLFWRPGYRNRTMYLAVELLVTGSCYLYMSIGLHLNRATVFILIPVLMAGYLLNKRNAVWTIPVFIVLLPLGNYFTAADMTTFLMQYIDIGIFFGFGFAFNFIITSQSKTEALLAENLQQYELIQKQNQALEQYARQIEQLTLLEERNRLARDLHDTIGHHFTSVIVGLDAAAYLVDIHPEKAKKRIETLAQVARGGLDEIRRSIHQIAPDEDEPFLQQLEKLAQTFSQHTGTEVRIHTEGSAYDITQAGQLTLVRCLQEALTNAKRHGDATVVDVALSYQPDAFSMRLVNNGHTPELLQHGFGLNAMRQRLEALNGSLETVSTKEAGFVLTCTLPRRKEGIA
ncbi:sensor histidine kinase [Ectobacillus ponti]|uniref:histidine kinase n=1 Tax=Ectobacillus ponti TaxID=2961894 RepID=A0AA41XB04_9BACI|nr:histidine kinase [Ectobacillus ponti]MCP8969548.1 histidine kinase [Ectobacillus ponti]